jgi:hypothetical protein
MRRLLADLCIVAGTLAAFNLGVGRALPAEWPHASLQVRLPPWRDFPEMTTVFLGSSQTYRQVDPTVVDSLLALQGVPSLSVNLGSPTLAFPATHRLLRRILEERPPTLTTVVLELRHPRAPIAAEARPTRGTYSYTPAYARFLWAYEMSRSPVPDLATQARRLVEHGLVMAEGFLHVGLGRGLTAMAITPASDRSNRGYVPLGEGLAVRRGAVPLDALALRTNRTTSLDAYRSQVESPVLQGFLTMIADEARAAGVRLVFLIPPRQPAAYLEVPLAAAASGAAVIDLGDPWLHPDFYRVGTSADVIHLNARGARLYSRTIARCLAIFRRTEDGQEPGRVCTGAERRPRQPPR